MAVNDTSELIVRGSLSVNSELQTYVHTLHFRHLSIPVGVSPEPILIDRWQAIAQTAWRAAHTSAYNLDEIVCRQVCGSIPLRAPAVEGVGLAGTRATPASQALAHWLSSVVTEYSDLAGRSRRGRYFVSGAHEEDLSGNSYTSGYLALVTAYNTALLGGFGPSGSDTDFRLVVHSRKLAANPGTACQDASRIVTQLVTRTRLTTQRSRRPRTVA